jgi:glycosyltransferase involved in cell wall biosynthesis
MNICLDVRYKKESGSSSYINHIVPAILKKDRNNRYLIIKYPKQKLFFEKDVSETILSPAGTSDVVQLAWTIGIVPFLMRKKEVDIYHSMKMIGPIWMPTKSVMTMHSIYGNYKGQFPVNWKTKIFIYIDGNRVVKRADRVIAVSDFVEDYLIESFGVPREKIDVVYHGIDSNFQMYTSERISPVLKKFNLPANYVLCVGNVTPVKNHLTAVRALANEKNRTDIHLVIAGDLSNAYAQRVREEIQAHGLSKRVSLLGFVAGTDLISLMSGAKFLLFPSLTEGCPVTMLEALKCGLPIVASKRGGLWDIGKDCCLFVEDPSDDKSFSAHMMNILNSDAFREEMRKKALRKASEFTWENAAEAHIRSYEMAGKSPCRGVEYKPHTVDFGPWKHRHP